MRFILLLMLVVTAALGIAASFAPPGLLAQTLAALSASVGMTLIILSFLRLAEKLSPDRRATPAEPQSHVSLPTPTPTPTPSDAPTRRAA